MTERPFASSQSKVLQTLHGRVLTGDVLAQNEMCLLLIPLLKRSIRRCRVRNVDASTLESAIDDALMIYLSAPQRYDPTRAPLTLWLTRITLNKIRDVERQRRRTTEHEARIAEEMLRELRAKPRLPEGNAESTWSKLRGKVLKVAKNESERVFLAAVLEGEWRTEPLARVLGLELLPTDERRKQVKRYWDRLRARLDAAAGLPNNRRHR